MLKKNLLLAATVLAVSGTFTVASAGGWGVSGSTNSGFIGWGTTNNNASGGTGGSTHLASVATQNNQTVHGDAGGGGHSQSMSGSLAGVTPDLGGSGTPVAGSITFGTSNSGQGSHMNIDGPSNGSSSNSNSNSSYSSNATSGFGGWDTSSFSGHAWGHF